MKLPKEMKRYCSHCKKHTTHLVGTAKQKARSATRKLSRGSDSRARARGLKTGSGNKGKWGSKPAVKAWKRKTKTTKRITVEYKCKTCKKVKQASKAIRSGRIVIGEKVSK
jgi:large subunit ribosomal protein L44e